MTAMTYGESFVTFECSGDACLGVVTLPVAARDVGVVIVVGGPQYRVGSHRQFALLARSLAAEGIAVLRFDYRGMGDSEGVARTFEDVEEDVCAAMDALRREAGVERVVLWGLCDGASAALMQAADDARVAGVVAVNPWVRTERTLASVRLRHYYLQRLASREFWQKALRGALDVRRGMQGVADSLRATRGRPTGVSFLERMEAGWRALRVPVLFILSGRDLTAREFETWAGGDSSRRARLASSTVCAIAEADHTFTARSSRETMTAATIGWIATLCRAS